MNGLCEKIKPVVAAGCIGVSLIKGVHFTEDGVELISEMISKVNLARLAQLLSLCAGMSATDA
jgi:hypothetical protein